MLHYYGEKFQKALPQKLTLTGYFNFFNSLKFTIRSICIFGVEQMAYYRILAVILEK